MIPEKVLNQHIAILGKTGSGKTYLAKGIAEHLLSQKKRVCILDPTSVWWGLRSDSTGKKAAFPIVVFGGEHADVPLGRNHGAAIAEIVGTTDTPAVLDTRLMTVGDRTQFFTDFGEALLRKNKGPLHLIVDEAHLFAPQGRVNDPQSGKMLHAANNLVSLGRGVGLRVILISQRPAKLHKDSLTQAETLIAMRLIAPQDRNAVEDWIGEWADPKQGAELLKSLPSLPTGEGWLWSPEAGILERCKFPKISTYDSSRAPDGDVGKIVLANIDLPTIQARLETVAHDAFENDPKRLRAKLADLQKQLNYSNAKPNQNVPPPEKEIDRAFERGAKSVKAELGKRVREYQRSVESKLSTAGAFLKRAADSLQMALGAFGDAPKLSGLDEIIAEAGKFAPPAPARAVMASRTPLPPRKAVTNASSNGHGEHLPPGERAIMIACAQYPDGVTREQLSILTGYKRSSRDAYIQRLRGREFITDQGSIFATQAGVDALGSDYEPLPVGEELQRYWIGRLPEGERAILKVLIEAAPNAVDRSALDDATGYKRSSRDAYIQRLKARKLVRVGSEGVTASEELF